MPFPTTGVLTNFTGSDEAPISEGGLWLGPLRTTANQMRRVSNQAANPTTGGATGESYRAGITYNPDQEVYATLATLSGLTGHFFGLCARVQNPNTASVNFYVVETAATTLTTYTPTFYRVISGAFTSLSVGSARTTTAGEVWGLEVTGTGANVTLRLFIQSGGVWSQYGSDVVDSNAARIVGSGSVAMYAGGATSSAIRLDDFGGGSIAFAPPPPIRIPNRRVGPAALRRIFRQPQAPVYLAAGATQAISGAINGTSSVSASVVRDRALSATINGVASVSGSVVRIRAISPSSAGVASVSASIVRTRAITASSTGVASVSASVVRTRSIAPSINGVASVSGSVVRVRAIPASISGVASVISGIVRTRAISGTSSGLATVTASVTKAGSTPSVDNETDSWISYYYH